MRAAQPSTQRNATFRRRCGLKAHTHQCNIIPSASFSILGLLMGTMALSCLSQTPGGQVTTALTHQKGHPSPNNYIILTVQRSSSSHFCSVLNRAPDTMCFGELIKPRILSLAADFMEETFGKAHPYISHITSKMDVIEYLLGNRLCNRTQLCSYGKRPRQCQQDECAQQNRMNKGFKLMYHHLESDEELSQTLLLTKKYNASIIHLVRASAFRRQVSLDAAQATEYWGSSKSEVLPTLAHANRLHINVTELASQMKEHVDAVTKWAAFLSQNGIRHKTVFYEELRMRERFLPLVQVYCEVFEFLGVPCEVNRKMEFTRDANASTRYYGYISNVEEVERAFPYDTCELQHGSMFS